MSPKEDENCEPDFLQCPKCLGHLEKVREGKDYYWDCPRCALRLKMWNYFPGSRPTDIEEHEVRERHAPMKREIRKASLDDRGRALRVPWKELFILFVGIVIGILII